MVFRGIVTFCCVFLLWSNLSLADVANARGLLNSRVPNVNLDSVPLADAFEQIRQSTQLNLVVNWVALETVGVGQDTAITLNLRRVRLAKLMDLVLQQASADAELAWYVEDNIVFITTRQLADVQMFTVVYDVMDLLVEIPNFDNAPEFSLNSGRGGGGSGGGSSGGTGGGLFGGSGGGSPGGNDEETTTLAERAENLITLIQMIVEPDVWQDNGGMATIRHFNGQLIVTAPRRIHRRIGG